MPLRLTCEGCCHVTGAIAQDSAIVSRRIFKRADKVTAIQLRALQLRGKIAQFVEARHWPRAVTTVRHIELPAQIFPVNAVEAVPIQIEEARRLVRCIAATEVREKRKISLFIGGPTRQGAHTVRRTEPSGCGGFFLVFQ